MLLYCKYAMNNIIYIFFILLLLKTFKSIVKLKLNEDMNAGSMITQQNKSTSLRAEKEYTSLSHCLSISLS